MGLRCNRWIRQYKERPVRMGVPIDVPRVLYQDGIGIDKAACRAV